MGLATGTWSTEPEWYSLNSLYHPVILLFAAVCADRLNLLSLLCPQAVFSTLHFKSLP